MNILNKLFPKEPLIRSAVEIYSMTKYRTFLNTDQIKDRLYTNIRNLIDSSSLLDQTAAILTPTPILDMFKSDVINDFNKEGYHVSEVEINQTYYIYISWDITKSELHEETRLGTSDVQV